MKIIMRFLSIAALTLVGTAMISCDTVDNAIFLPQQIQQQAQTSNTVTLKTTVSIGGGTAEARGTTRALDEHGHKTFAVGDQIKVLYHQGASILTESSVSNALTADDISPDGKTATFTVTLTDPQENGEVTYIYPASYSESNLMNGQDGTLTSLAANHDFARGKGNMTGTELPGSITLKNVLTIGAYTIKNSSGTDITNTITGMTISYGNKTYVINRDADSGPIYAAMFPTSSDDIVFTATDGTNNYTKSVAAKTYEAGHFYHLGLTMIEATPSTIDLSSLSANYVAQDGDVLTGVLDGSSQAYKISIADRATITLRNATINGINDYFSEWAGLTPIGDATIVLEGTNVVKGFYDSYPGIYAAVGKTLTIRGDGSLTASPYDGGGTEDSNGAGIGSGYHIPCGNIVIESGTINATAGYFGAGIGGCSNGDCGNITISGGTITATGGECGAGIGGGYDSSCQDISISGGTIIAAPTGEYNGSAGIGASESGTCGNITISGGTITATGGYDAAGIGSGSTKESSCGDITITSDVTKVTAIKREDSINCIGTGFWGECGTVTIGGTIYWDGEDYQNDGDEYLTTSPLVYPAP